MYKRQSWRPPARAQILARRALPISGAITLHPPCLLFIISHIFLRKVNAKSHGKSGILMLQEQIWETLPQGPRDARPLYYLLHLRHVLELAACPKIFRGGNFLQKFDPSPGVPGFNSHCQIQKSSQSTHICKSFVPRSMGWLGHCIYTMSFRTPLVDTGRFCPEHPLRESRKSRVGLDASNFCQGPRAAVRRAICPLCARETLGQLRVFRRFRKKSRFAYRIKAHKTASK